MKIEEHLQAIVDHCKAHSCDYCEMWGLCDWAFYHNPTEWCSWNAYKNGEGFKLDPLDTFEDRA